MTKLIARGGRNVIDETEIRAQIGMLVIGLQALYLAHPNQELAISQLERMAQGSADLMLGSAIPDKTLERLNELLQALIAALRCAATLLESIN